MTEYIGKLTREKAEELRRADTMIEFMVHPVLIPALVDWIDSRDADLVQGPSDSDDDSGIPWFVLSPRSLGRP